MNTGQRGVTSVGVRTRSRTVGVLFHDLARADVEPEARAPSEVGEDLEARFAREELEFDPAPWPNPVLPGDEPVPSKEEEERVAFVPVRNVRMGSTRLKYSRFKGDGGQDVKNLHRIRCPHLRMTSLES